MRTDVVGIELDVVDGVFHEVHSLVVGFVALPVASDHPLVSGEELFE